MMYREFHRAQWAGLGTMERWEKGTNRRCAEPKGVKMWEIRGEVKASYGDLK